MGAGRRCYGEQMTKVKAGEQTTPGFPRELFQEAVRLLQATLTVTSSLDPAEIPKRAVEALQNGLGFPVVSIALWDAGREKLSLVASRGLPEEFRTMGFRNEGTAHSVATSGRPMFVEDTSSDPRVHPRARSLGKAYACLPIRHLDQIQGVLYVHFAGLHPFPTEERSLLEAFAQLVGIALHNAHLNQSLVSALEQVQTMSGLIPICSYCKQIRTDQGFWQQVESYIQARTDVRFSHGICPSCAEAVKREVENLKPARVIPAARP